MLGVINLVKGDFLDGSFGGVGLLRRGETHSIG